MEREIKVKYIDHMGTDETIIEAARMSTGKGFEGWETVECKTCGAKLSKWRRWEKAERAQRDFYVTMAIMGPRRLDVHSPEVRWALGRRAS